MKSTICALLIAIYLLAVQWSADLRWIAGLEKIVAELELIVVMDKLIIDKWTGLDWDREKPIRKDCEKVNFCWTELDSCTLYQ